MVVRKRALKTDRAVQVEWCFSCGAIVDRGVHNVVAVMWGDGDPGRDEVVYQWRQSRARMCRKCRAQVSTKGGLDFQLGLMRVEVISDEVPDLAKVRGDRVLPIRVIRRRLE